MKKLTLALTLVVLAIGAYLLTEEPKPTTEVVSLAKAEETISIPVSQEPNKPSQGEAEIRFSMKGNLNLK